MSGLGSGLVVSQRATTTNTRQLRSEGVQHMFRSSESCSCWGQLLGSGLVHWFVEGCLSF